MIRMYNIPFNLNPDEIIVYLRKSQSDDPLLTDAEVLARHEAILDEWAENHVGERVPEENKFREVVSGETLKERPEINKVLRLIESPKFKAVCAVDPQRLTRGDLEDIGRLMKLLKHTRTLVITPERTYNLQDEYDWNAFEGELKRGNDYLKYTKKILNRGRLLSVSQGNYIGSIAPYGYDKTVVPDGRRKCPTLKINEENAQVVRMAYDLFVNKNMGLAGICYRFDEMGIKPPRGEHWSTEGLRGILSNVHNIGKVKWYTRKTAYIVEDGEIRKTLPRSKDGEQLVFDGKHPAIVPESLFNAACEKLGKSPRAKAKAKIRNPLAGLVYCSCGRAMSYRTYKKDGVERSSPRLICDGQAYCGAGSCLYSEMLDAVCEALREHIADFEIKIKNTPAHDTQNIKVLERRLKDIESRELAQWEQQSDPDPAQRMPPGIFKQLNEKLLREKDSVVQMLKEAREGQKKSAHNEEKKQMFADALDALKSDEVDAAKKNKLLKACIERIIYTRETPKRLSGKGAHAHGGWIAQPISIKIKFKI